MSRSAVAPPSSLGPEELAEVVLSLNRALKVFERAHRPFTAPEISARTMLSVLRSEVEAQLRGRNPDANLRQLW